MINRIFDSALGRLLVFLALALPLDAYLNHRGESTLTRALYAISIGLAVVAEGVRTKRRIAQKSKHTRRVSLRELDTMTWAFQHAMPGPTREAIEIALAAIGIEVDTDA